MFSYVWSAHWHKSKKVTRNFKVSKIQVFLIYIFFKLPIVKISVILSSKLVFIQFEFLVKTWNLHHCVGPKSRLEPRESILPESDRGDEWIEQREWENLDVFPFFRTRMPRCTFRRSNERIFLAGNKFFGYSSLQQWQLGFFFLISHASRCACRAYNLHHPGRPLQRE